MKPETALEKCTDLRDGDQDTGRATNRARLNAMFKGEPPATQEEAAANRMFTNVSPMMASRIAVEAAMKLGAVSRGGTQLFTVAVDTGKRDQDAVVSGLITEHLNRYIRKSDSYKYKLKCTDSTMVIHGRGPCMWDDKYSWKPTALGIEDLLIPARVQTDFSDLSYFAVYQPLSAAKIMRLLKAKYRKKGWNDEALRKGLALLLKDSAKPNGPEEDFVEKSIDDASEHVSFYSDDSTLPMLKCYHLWNYEDDGREMVWKRYIVADEPEMDKMFLYEDKTGEAVDVSSLMQVQYANMSPVAPFKYHAVRGLGFLLYPVLEVFNLMFCRFVDHGLESMNQMYKNIGETERDKVGVITMANYSEMPPGVEMVTANDRYSVNHNLIGMLFGFLRQQISEQSSNFTQDSDAGTRKAMTASEALARVRQAEQMSALMIDQKIEGQEREYKEIARRFTLKNSRDKDVQKFQERMEQMGIKDKMLDYERWEVSIDRAGINASPELSSAVQQVMMEARGAFPPESQQKILRNWAAVVNRSAEVAADLVPFGPTQASDTVTFATMAFTALCDLSEVQVPSYVNLPEYVAIMFNHLRGKLTKMAQAQVQPDRESVAGILNAAQHIQNAIQVVSQDPANTENMKAVQQMLDQLLQEAAPMLEGAQTGPQMSPEDQAKVNAIYAKAQAEAQVNAAKAEQKTQDLAERTQYKLAVDRVKDEQALAINAVKARQDMAINAATASQERATEAVKAVQEIGANQAKAKAKSNEPKQT